MGNDIVNNKKSYTMHSSFYFKWWGRWDLNPHGINSQRILSPLRLPISPRPHKKLEVPTGFEPVITELQSIALPLGYGTGSFLTRCYNILT